MKLLGWWVFREFCWVKKPNPKLPQTAWFHLSNILEMTKWQKRRMDEQLPEGKLGSGSWLCYKRKIQDILVVVKLFASWRCTSASLMVRVVHCRLARCYCWGKLTKSYTGLIYIISHNCTWIYKYLTIKKFNWKWRDNWEKKCILISRLHFESKSLWVGWGISINF